MRIATTLLIGSLGISAAIAADMPILTVPEVVEQHEALNGRVVRVRGWLTSECYRSGCSISARRDGGESLSIGGWGKFDLALKQARAIGQEILVEGRVDRTCFNHGKEPGSDPSFISVCADRADQLADPKLVKVFSTQEK